VAIKAASPPSFRHAGKRLFGLPTVSNFLMEGNDARIIDKICDYSEKAEIKPLLKEYMKR
jgi:hypothetical protein